MTCDEIILELKSMSSERYKANVIRSDSQMGCSIYDVLPNIKETTFKDAPKPQVNY